MPDLLEEIFRPKTMSAFSTQALEEKIVRLSLSQDSIETLSLWIIQYKAHANDSVRVWLDETKKGTNFVSRDITHAHAH